MNGKYYLMELPRTDFYVNIASTLSTCAFCENLKQARIIFEEYNKKYPDRVFAIMKMVDKSEITGLLEKRIKDIERKMLALEEEKKFLIERALDR